MDRISCLPDEVICHILSFLPTVESVQTSVLSKRWKFLWVGVPFLEFNIDDTDRYDYYSFVEAKDWILNSKIINKILLQHKHDIHTFHYINALHEYEKDIDGSEEEFQSWIVNITSRKIRNLVIRLRNQFVLPQCLFTCNTLVDLFLFGCGDIPTSGIYFPVLKKLKLHYVQYKSNDSLAHFISACPVLEKLSIKGKVLGHCCVSSPTLTRLVLNILWGDNMNFRVKLDTPALMYLRLSFSMPDIFSVGPLNSLIKANICLSAAWLHEDNCVQSLLQFVGKLYNVQHLRLSANRTTVINEYAFSALGIKFPNLTKLDLSRNISFITNFLESANNLRVLELSWIVVGFDIQSCWMEPKRVPACLISHLQTVVCNFGCSEHGYVFDILRYILMNAKVLKRMEIHSQLRNRKRVLEKKFEELKRLSSFERGSRECQLVFD